MANKMKFSISLKCSCNCSFIELSVTVVGDLGGTFVVDSNSPGFSTSTSAGPVQLNFSDPLSLWTVSLLKRMVAEHVEV